MPEIIFTGPAGRLEGRYQPAKETGAPIALILHPHPQFGGTMNNRATYEMYNIFKERGFAVLRFNFRGVGRSQGEFDLGVGELSDAATALDYLQSQNPGAKSVWVAGYSFGSWISMQLLMRRPEIVGFITAAPNANVFDFSFLAPCPSSGLVLHGTADRVCPVEDARKMVERTRVQKGRTIEFDTIDGADHFFESHMDEFVEKIGAYIDKRFEANEGGRDIEPEKPEKK